MTTCGRITRSAQKTTYGI